MTYYGPKHICRYEVHGAGPNFYTDSLPEAIRVASERSKAAERVVYIYDVEDDIIGVYDFGARYGYLKK